MFFNLKFPVIFEGRGGWGLLILIYQISNFVFQIKLIWFEAWNIKFCLTSRNQAHFILKTLFHVAHPKYYLRKYWSLCCFFSNYDNESIEKTVLVLLSRRIINDVVQYQSHKFFLFTENCVDFLLGHYLNCLFKYTKIAVQVLWFLDFFLDFFYSYFNILAVILNI